MRLLQRIWRERSGGWRPDRGGRSSRVAAALLAAVAVSALATLGAAPILAWHFGELSIIGLLANPIVVPLMGTGALGLGLTGMVLVPLVPAMSSAAFWLSGLCVWIAVEVARVLSAWPFAAVPVAWEPALTGSIAAAVATLPAPRARIRVARAAAGALLGTALMAVLSSSDPGLRVSFLDVGQGDAALVELGPKELRFLVDGGGLARGREPGERVLMPTLQRRGIARLDGGVVSHPEWDHFGGFETVTRAGKAAAIWRAEPRGGSPAWRRFEAALAERGVPVRVARPGRFLPIARSLGEVDVLHPTASFEPASSNDASLVLRVRYGAASVLFTGDIEARAEAWLVTRGVALGASVVKVPHHGSATSSGQAFVRAVHPALAVASLGRGNAFRFPASTVVERYRRGGSEWLSTDRTGEVIVESDGQVIRLRRCRSEIRQSRADGARW
jgi:competence protein ComEC